MGGDGEEDELIKTSFGGMKKEKTGRKEEKVMKRQVRADGVQADKYKSGWCCGCKLFCLSLTQSSSALEKENYSLWTTLI